MARQPAALHEGILETISPEDTALLNEDRASEREALASEPQEAAPAPAAAPVTAEAPAAAAPQESDEERGQGMTPEQARIAVRQERDRAKAAERRVRELEQETARFNGRLEALQQLATAPKAPEAAPQAPEIPDVDADPIGHFKARTQLLESLVGKMAEGQQQRDQQTQTQTNVQRLMQITAAQEQDYIREEPAYPQAAKYLYDARNTELEAMGIIDPVARQNIIQNDVASIAAQALQVNKNVAAVITQIAKARGWAGPQPLAAPAPVATPAPNGATAPAEDAAALLAESQSKLAAVARGQEAGQSLGQLSGSAQPAPLTAERIARMSDAEFAAEYDRLKKQPGGLKAFMENTPRN